MKGIKSVKPNPGMSSRFRDAIRRTGMTNLEVALKLGLTTYQIDQLMSGKQDVDHKTVRLFCREFSLDHAFIDGSVIQG